MHNVIITGVSGQVGSYMAEYCLEMGHKVHGVIRRTSTPNVINYSHLISNPNFHLVQADLTDGSSIEEIVRNIKPDYFINLAAQSFVGVSWKIPEETFNVDALGVIRCLESIRKNVPSCRFYNAGSSEQFGNVDYVPQDEKHPFKPRSPYGAAKCAAHHIIKVYRESYGIYAVQGLLFNHESERRGEEFVTRKVTKGVARINHSLIRGKEFQPIFLGNVDAKRDWSHALDFVDGIWKMVNQDSPKDYVLSSGEAHSIREFVEVAFKSANIDGHWSKIDDAPESEVFVSGKAVLVRINPLFYRPAEVDILLGSSELARKELGWNPRINFRELVDRMVHNDLIIVG
jgi:GDPmannose 4,6-dehydratase